MGSYFKNSPRSYKFEIVLHDCDSLAKNYLPTNDLINKKWRIK